MTPRFDIPRIRNSESAFIAPAVARQELLVRSLIGLAVACSLAAGRAGAAEPAPAPAPAPAPQAIEIHPSLALEIDASDNIRRSATNQESDVVFVPQAGLLVTGETPSLKVYLTANLRYEAFVDQSSLDRLTGSLFGHGTLTLVPDFFFLDGNAQISDEFLKIADSSPSGLPNGNAQTRVFNTQISPYIKTQLFGEADATLRAGVSELQFEDIEGSPSASLNNSTIYQGSGLLTNGERSRLVEWRLSGDYTFENRDSQDLESADGLLGLSVKVTPKIHVVGRIGYETISDPAISDINDVIWSGGFIYKFGEISEITAERRHRFGRDAWYGDLNLALSSRLAVTGGYEERFESQQLRLSRSLSEVFAQSGTLPTPPSPVALDEDLVDQAFFVKDARLGVSYHTEQSAFDLSAHLSERDFTALSTSDKTAGVGARYSEALPANLRLELTGGYNATLEARVGEVETQNYVASGGLIYLLSEDTAARVTYTWSQTDGLATISENLISASVAKTF